jgi:transposase
VNVLKPHLQTTIRTLLEAGATQREIERVTRVSRHTIRAWQKRFAEEVAANCSGVATGPAEQTPPPRLPAPTATTTSLCEPHRPFIEAQLRLKRNATAVYQDLVDQFGFAGHYNSVKRFVARLKVREPEQFDRLEFAPGEEMQVDYGEGALTRVPGSSRYRRPRLFVATLRYSRRSFRRVVWKSSQQVLPAA